MKTPDIYAYINNTLTKLKTSKPRTPAAVSLTGKMIITDYFYLGGPIDTESYD